MILSEDLKYWRAERPDEWTMDDFIRKAEALEKQLKEKESPLSVPFNEVLCGQEPSEEMLIAAMKKAVEVGIVAKWADEETYLKNWGGMKEILKAAMAA